MVYVGADWVELDYWTSPTWGDYDARMRVLARSSQNVAGNFSRIEFKLQKRVTGGSAYSLDDREFTISMSGHSASQTWNFGSVSDTDWQDVGGDTSDMHWSNVAHNSDGALTISANASGDRPMGGTFDTDITIELPTIARTSVPTVSPNPITINSGTNTLTVYTNRQSSSFTHTVRADVWSFQETKTGVGASTTFNIPYSVINAIPSSQLTAEGTIYVTTYSGSTQIGSEQKVVFKMNLLRYSVPTVKPNPQTWSNTSSNTITVTTNRKSSSYTHSVRCELWGYNTTKTGVGASTTFAIPYSTLSSMPDNQTSFTGSVYTQTYSGSTKVGSEIRSTWVVRVDTSKEHPNVGSITVTDTNTKTSSVVSSGQMVSGMSTLKATIPLTVTGSYTQLASATVKCGNKTQTYSLSGTSQTITFTFDKVTASSLSVTVKDKRGTKATGSKSWTLLGYQPLTLTGSVSRPSATGTTVKGTVKGSAYGGKYGSSTNSLTITVQSKLHSASSYGNTETYTQAISGNGQQSYSKTMTFTHTFPYTDDYDVRYTVADLFSSATYTSRLTQGLPILSWDETEVDVWGDLHIHYRAYPDYYWGFGSTMNAIARSDGVRNLLPKYTGSVTKDGITFTASANGVVTANGTATAQTQWSDVFEWNQGTGNYYFSGCPDGGSSTTYDTYMWDRDANARPKQWDGETAIVSCYGDTLDQSKQVRLEYGKSYSYIIRIENGVTVNNLKFYPMVREYRIASNTFWPYAHSNYELDRLLTNVLRSNTFTSASVSVPANSAKSVNVTITIPSGYRVKAITRAWTNGEVLIAQCNSSTTSTMTSATVWVRNVTSASVSVTVTIEVLFIKEEFV